MGQICEGLAPRPGPEGGAPYYGQPQGPLQPCFKCQGKGFCHDSSMDHDKDPGERCFFCKDCNSCGGRGAIPGPQATVVMPGQIGLPPAVVHSGGRQPCFKCQGKGFCHMSSMDHDKGEGERCFFCKDCDGCGGSGSIAGGQQTVVAPVVMPGMMPGMMMPGMGMPAVVQTGGGLQPCFKCTGKGFCHNSSMDHDKGDAERCFFCKDCDACGGSGAIAGAPTQTVVVPGMVPGMMPGMMMPGMGVPVVVQTGGGLQPCFKCQGKGFCHNSSMDHDKGDGERCFFCKDCDGCGGSGAIRG